MLAGRNFEEGHSELKVYYRLQVSAPEKHKELYIYFFLLHTHATSA